MQLSIQQVVQLKKTTLTAKMGHYYSISAQHLDGNIPIVNYLLQNGL